MKCQNCGKPKSKHNPLKWYSHSENGRVIRQTEHVVCPMLPEGAWHFIPIKRSNQENTKLGSEKGNITLLHNHDEKPAEQRNKVLNNTPSTTKGDAKLPNGKSPRNSEARTSQAAVELAELFGKKARKEK